MKKARDYAAEYARRIARGLTRGLTKSQARGHSKATEASLRAPKPISDGRLQLALRVLRQEGSLAAAARAGKISPERLRKFASEQKIIEKDGLRWRTRADLPRRTLILGQRGLSRTSANDLSLPCRTSADKTSASRRGSAGDGTMPPAFDHKSVCSERASASSTSPRYRTVLSSLVWPSNSWHARRLPFRL